MVYFLETILPKNKPVVLSLPSIYGIGSKIALLICKKLGFSLNLKTKDLTEEQIVEILKLIDSLNLSLNNELKKKEFLRIKDLVSIKSYRGLRLTKGLPVRGQRTHTNAKSAKRKKRF